jgi:hypothetical protein
MPQQDQSFSLPSVDSGYQLVRSMPTGDEKEHYQPVGNPQPCETVSTNPSTSDITGTSPPTLPGIVANSTSSNNFLFRAECRCDQQPSGVHPGHHWSIPQRQNELRSFHDDELYHVQSTHSNWWHLSKELDTESVEVRSVVWWIQIPHSISRCPKSVASARPKIPPQEYQQDREAW